MSWDTRATPPRPGTGPGKRKSRDESEIDRVRAWARQGGFYCPACGDPIADHADVDCVTTMGLAVKAVLRLHTGITKEEFDQLARTLYETTVTFYRNQSQVIEAWRNTFDSWGLLEEEEKS